MPDDTITLVSTTDSAEEVQAALTNKPVAKAEAPAPASEPPAPPPAPPVEPEAEPEAEAETDTEATEPPADETSEARATREASEAGSKLAKRKKSIQDEIHAITRRKYDLRNDVEAEQARLSELRRQREELEAAVKPPPPPVEAKPAGPTAPLGRTEPKIDAVDEKGDAKYATYEDYLSDHAVWTREEALLATRKLIDEEKAAERERIDRASTDRVVNDRLVVYNTALETFKKTHADFDAAFEDAKDAVQDTLIGLGPNALKIIDGYTVFDAQDGPALAYHLLKHPDELKAIAMKAPPQQLVALARLEERIRPAAAKRSGPSAVTPLETKAPEPIKPVGSGPTATAVATDDESYQDYRARRERELRARRGL
jgi:hypothetical protein